MPSNVAPLWSAWSRRVGGKAGPLGATGAGSGGSSVPSIVLTFDATLGRVRVEAFSLGSLATYAVVDRSTDGITWTTVRGGAAVELDATQNLPVPVDDYEWSAVATTYRVRSYSSGGGLEVTVSDSITPTLDGPWLKSIARPFLNQEVEFGGDQLPIMRRPRGGVFDIVGRSLPVAVTDVRGSRQYTVILRTETAQAAEDLDLLLASGDILFTHGSQCRVPSGVYWFVGDVEQLQPLAEDEWRLTTIEVIEVAAPGPDVVGATSSWQTVINAYATWSDVIAANASWADLLELVGDPSEVVVP